MTRSVTTATWLTLSRIFLIPLFLWVLLSGSLRLAFLLFAAGVVTDWLDGKVARDRHQITPLGALLDPLADKLLVLSALIAMVELGMVGAIPVILLVAREFFVTTVRGGAAERHESLPAKSSGKVKVVLEYAAIFFLLLGWPGGNVLLWLAVALAFVSALPYWGR